MEHIFNKEIIVDKQVCRFLGVLAFIAAMTLGAYIRIPLPFTPVPVTLQTFFVLLSAAFLGPSASVLTQALYIALGLSGLSVFSGYSLGASYMLGPTAGYLAGFVISAYFLGKVIRTIDRTFVAVIAAFTTADIIILSCGTVWLRLFYFKDTMTAFMLGFLPFIFGDIIKVFIAAAVYFTLKDRLKEIL